jgi:hypothetical protein
VALPTSLALQTDTWVKATWDNFVATMDTTPYDEGRGYFDNGYMRVEMAALGGGHARQNSVVSKVVSLFGMVQSVRLAEFTNGSFHKTGERGCQPDVAFYIGPDFRLPPRIIHPLISMSMARRPWRLKSAAARSKTIWVPSDCSTNGWRSANTGW